MERKQRVVIVGGGIFGLTAAIVLGEAGYSVTVIEKRVDVMQEASLVNQNRIHLGYHYPRSRTTCEESLNGLAAFKAFFGNCIYDQFKKYYAIAKRGSHVTPDEFSAFCRSLKLPLTEGWPDDGVLNRDQVAACWLTPEPIFDYHKLKQIVLYRIAAKRNIRVIRNSHVVSLAERSDGKELRLTTGYKVICDFVVNATYSGLPDFVTQLGKERVKAKFELCVMPIVEIDDPPAPFGVTVMDGPFCSLMPKGFSRNHFILYHVVHSVVQQHVGYHSVEWAPIDGIVELEIIEHCKAFYPILEKMKLRDSWITTRMVLPEQELDDARPTLIIDHGSNIFSVFSGKLTTCVNAAMDVKVKIEAAS